MTIKRIFLAKGWCLQLVIHFKGYLQDYARNSFAATKDKFILLTHNLITGPGLHFLAVMVIFISCIFLNFIPCFQDPWLYYFL